MLVKIITVPEHTIPRPCTFAGVKQQFKSPPDRYMPEKYHGVLFLYNTNKFGLFNPIDKKDIKIIEGLKDHPEWAILYKREKNPLVLKIVMLMTNKVKNIINKIEYKIEVIKQSTNERF